MTLPVIAIMAHPDDIEIHIGGTLCLLRDRGFAVHCATVCRGDIGSMKLARDEIAAIRRSEAQAAARQIGATYDGLGFDDLRVTYSMEIKDAIVALLRRYRAGIVITHPPRDYMADHELTSLLAREACFAAPAPNWPSSADPGLEPLGAIPELYYCDPTSQVDADGRITPATITIDITSAIDRKRAMLECHDSQRSWLRDQHGEDNYILSMLDWARIRGRQVGVEYAEGFRQHLGHPFPGHSTLREALASFIASE